MAWGPHKETVLRYDEAEYHRKMQEADQHPGETLVFVPGKDSDLGHFEWRKEPAVGAADYTTEATGTTEWPRS